jgi:hypothetical protein
MKEYCAWCDACDREIARSINDGIALSQAQKHENDNHGGIDDFTNFFEETANLLTEKFDIDEESI